MAARVASVAPQMIHQSRSLARICGSGFIRSRPDRVPGGLELEQVAQLAEALRLVGVPVGGLLRLEQLRALYAFGGTELERLALLGVRHAKDRTQMRVR